MSGSVREVRGEIRLSRHVRNWCRASRNQDEDPRPAVVENQIVRVRERLTIVRAEIDDDTGEPFQSSASNTRLNRVEYSHSSSSRDSSSWASNVANNPGYGM